MILSFLSVAVPISLQPSVCLHFKQHSVIVTDLNVFKIFLFDTLNGFFFLSYNNEIHINQKEQKNIQQCLNNFMRAEGKSGL